MIIHTDCIGHIFTYIHGYEKTSVGMVYVDTVTQCDIRSRNVTYGHAM